MPYFFDEHHFDRTNTDKIAGSYTGSWRDYADKLLKYACGKNFMKQTERTVFQQAMVRRESSSFPITYYDVKADGITMLSGPEMNQKILRIAGAMQAHGIIPGMKVALTGINCTDYIALDMAIGLCGAVSVPIYYTAPAEEINLLLEKSGSEWFFIGDKRIMSQISGIHTTAKTVGFGVVADAEKGKTDFTWSAFLGSAKQVYTAVAVETVIV